MKLLKKILVGLASLLLFLSIVAWLGFVHWLADVVALFVPYLAGGTAVLLLIFATLRHRTGIVLAALALLLNLIPLIGYLPLNRAAASQPTDLRLMVYNIYFRNNDLEAIMAEIESHDPDVVF